MSRVALARMSQEPIDAAACQAAVADEQAGGIGLFVGVVRSDDHGKGVTSLTYEAHPTADRIIAEVCSRAATDDLIAVAAEHRTGDLAIGDIAVVVAVSAVHRGEALSATHRLIDAVKTEVPIWKHQRFADGTTEWVGISC
ncbi:MAG TPA: molybdenum cofactor biosynthesis protein MoaE [Mycobacteriales bacterium]